MNIAVMIKVVNTQLVKQKSYSIERSINPFDIYALKQAVKLKDTYGGVITCITMGPPSVKKALQQCISLGADKCYLVEDPQFAGSDTIATSYILSEALKNIDAFDLYICGKQSTDGETGHVGSGIAVNLGIGYISGVQACLGYDHDTLLCTRVLENEIQKLQIKLPILLSFRDFSMYQGVHSLMHIKKSQSIDISTLNKNDLMLNDNKCGISGSMTIVVKSRQINFNKKGTTVEGSPEFKSEILIQLIQELCNRYSI